MPPVNRRVVRLAMAKARMKRAGLSEATGIPAKTLTNALGAYHQPLDDTKIQAICEALGLDFEDVIDEPADSNPSTEPAAADEPTAVPAEAMTPECAA